MHKRKKKEHDFSLVALQEATGQVEPQPEKPKAKKNFDAKALGHKGGLKAGKARAAKVTPEQWKEIAWKAAQTRWKVIT
jgi:hypothetical protein